MWLKFLTVSALLKIAQPASVSYTNSLADCQAFAATFDNTCDPTAPAVDFASVPTEDFTCNSNVNLCNGAAAGSSCTWKRKLCVTCSDVSGVVYIRVQSNSMPNHCYKADNGTPTEQKLDFTVKFNSDVGSTINS